MHSRPTFNDDPVDTKEDSDGEFRDLMNRNYTLDNFVIMIKREITYQSTFQLFSLLFIANTTRLYLKISELNEYQCDNLQQTIV